MKNCRDIRGDLSAYIDDELALSRREQISSHLEVCARCQQELSELKKVTAGVTALPRLQPAPRFLRDVRRKIAKGEDPEATTWLDHVFQPFWLKVPLEIAAIVLIVGLVLHGEHPAPQPVGNRELTSAADADTDNNRPDAVSQNADAKSVTEEPKPPAAQEIPALEEAKKESLETSTTQENEQKSTLTVESRAVSGADNESQSTANGVAVDGGNFSSGGGQQAASHRRLVAAASTQPSSGATVPVSPAMGLIGTFQSIQTKPREQVTVQSRDFASVRDRSQQLAARCNGKVLVGMPPTAGAEQVLFVEVPREYAAAFKVELSRTSSNALPQSSVAEGLDTTNFAATSPGGGMGGVLTGSVTTNSVTGNGTSSATGNQQAPTPTVILEIRVVEPTN